MLNTHWYVNDSVGRILPASPMPRRPITRAERKLETRTAIIDAAARLFVRNGIEATSIDAIAASIGLTKGAVYGSFGSKHELIKAVAERYSSPADVTPLLRVDLPLAERLRLFGRGVCAALQGASRLQMLLDFEYAVYAMRNKRWAVLIRETGSAGMRELAARFHAVNVARSERPPLGAEAFLTVLTVAVRGVVQQYALDPASLREPALEKFFVLLAGQPECVNRESPSRRSRRKPPHRA
jgi:TetR/AcrR family transcriptional regulator, transcriptional repressor of aconitase